MNDKAGPENQGEFQGWVKRFCMDTVLMLGKAPWRVNRTLIACGLDPYFLMPKLEQDADD